MWVAIMAEVAAPAVVETLDVTVRRPVVGDLKEGVQAYRPEFFTVVRPGTAMDMVQWLPGFTFEDVRNVRGLGGAVGNVLIDGQPPTSKTDTLSTVLRRIPAAQVERVDIIVGGAPGIDMRGRPVIANVVLKKTDEPKGTLTASVSAYTRERFGVELQANFARKSGERSFDASLNLRRSIPVSMISGVGRQVRTDGAGRVLFVADAYTRSAVMGATPTAAYEIPFAEGRLRVNGSYRYLRGHFHETAEASGVTSSNLLRDRYRQPEFGLRYTRELHGGLSLETQALERLSGYWNATRVARPGVLTDFATDQDGRESVLRATLRWKRGEAFTLEGAAEGALNTLDTRSSQSAEGAALDLPAASLGVEERRGDFGVTVTWKPQPAYGVVAALRGEASTIEASGDVSIRRALSYLKPRLVLSYAPDPKTQIRLRAEHEVDELDFDYFVPTIRYSGVVVAGNPAIRPRRAWVAEAVFERQFWTGASLVATIRNQSVRDVVEDRLAPGFVDVVQTDNIGGGHVTDLIGALSLPLGRLGWDGVIIKATLTRTWSEVTDPTTGNERGSGRAAWLGELHFSHDLPRWKLTWGADFLYMGRWTNYTPRQIEHIPTWPRLSAFVEYRLTPTLTVRAEGFNLNDYVGRSAIDYYAAPRPAPLDFRDDRELRAGRYLMFRVRRTLN